ncbi:hypothetical protein ACFFF5_17805 [Lederbergia wuyishanensis]|uniref:Phage protein n=1 Tax=Lederbergia wuyishanensis TaxID=1347903 RepID=A0ABU0D4F7_9BACI|nr:hypothetical protein [Lederbergia wuyishanensis]MCJ8008118.1 hypothetical protein [Lederbergia wuyishanensis]MDQ0343296.1 hypothetical protein [Lederbergia wuyishanensis]
MEKALRYEINKIPELKNRIYPTNAPEGERAPFLVYQKSRFQQTKTFEGIQNHTEAGYLLNILCSSYSQLQDLSIKLRKQLDTLPLRNIGNEGIYIQDMTVNNQAETYENELQLYRGIFDVTFYYEEA